MQIRIDVFNDIYFFLVIALNKIKDHIALLRLLTRRPIATDKY
jgi:hypothetical protein